jgi:hypothetical protein
MANIDEIFEIPPRRIKIGEIIKLAYFINRLFFHNFVLSS